MGRLDPHSVYLKAPSSKSSCLPSRLMRASLFYTPGRPFIWGRRGLGSPCPAGTSEGRALGHLYYGLELLLLILLTLCISTAQTTPLPQGQPPQDTHLLLSKHGAKTCPDSAVEIPGMNLLASGQPLIFFYWQICGLFSVNIATPCVSGSEKDSQAHLSGWETGNGEFIYLFCISN